MEQKFGRANGPGRRYCQKTNNRERGTRFFGVGKRNGLAIPLRFAARSAIPVEGGLLLSASLSEPPHRFPCSISSFLIQNPKSNCSGFGEAKMSGLSIQNSKFKIHNPKFIILPLPPPMPPHSKSKIQNSKSKIQNLPPSPAPEPLH